MADAMFFYLYHIIESFIKLLFFIIRWQRQPKQQRNNLELVLLVNILRNFEYNFEWVFLLEGPTVYTSEKNGSDENGDGSEEKPFKTPLQVWIGIVF
jgi:hypothetical protein